MKNFAAIYSRNDAQGPYTNMFFFFHLGYLDLRRKRCLYRQIERPLFHFSTFALIGTALLIITENRGLLMNNNLAAVTAAHFGFYLELVTCKLVRLKVFDNWT